MSYQRFKLPETASRAATLATLATLRDYPGQTVASIASVAGGKSETAILVRAAASPPEPDQAELEERAGLAMDSVPGPYLDAWARLQFQKPVRISDAGWRQAIDDAGRFLDQWGSLALEFQWTPAHLFDVPRDGWPGGLAWFLKGSPVTAIGRAMAQTQDGRIFHKQER